MTESKPLPAWTFGATPATPIPAADVLAPYTGPIDASFFSVRWLTKEEAEIARREFDEGIPLPARFPIPTSTE
jgi:hypothetical protein